VLREIKEDMAEIVEESKVRRKELAAAREKEGEQERENMLKSSEVRKESSKREREEGENRIQENTRDLKIQINGEWFRWDERQQKLEKIC
jgi:F0F1-type ATP synthase membrane subunit b/b'